MMRTNPQVLRSIHLPPIILYWRGEHPNTFKSNIAVVGARKANAYGARVVRQLIPPLLDHGWSIVSGGALGADTIAHNVALESSGATMAIIGSGLLCPYPEQNIPLFERIVARGGTVMSSLPLTMPPLPGNFPARNRIIAGMSRGTLVIQAAAKSGALITANYALQEGSEVFAVPGAIDDELSEGCHRLIAQGAHIVHSATDIVDVLGGTLMKKSTIAPSRVIPRTIIPQDPFLVLCARPISFDELLGKTHVAPQELQEKLFDLQLTGALEQTSSGLWLAV